MPQLQTVSVQFARFRNLQRTKTLTDWAPSGSIAHPLPPLPSLETVSQSPNAPARVVMCPQRPSAPSTIIVLESNYWKTSSMVSKEAALASHCCNRAKSRHSNACCRCWLPIAKPRAARTVSRDWAAPWHRGLCATSTEFLDSSSLDSGQHVVAYPLVSF